MRRSIPLLYLLITVFIIKGCGSSSGTSTEDEKKTKKTEEQIIPEKKKTVVFDMSPYHSTFKFNLNNSGSGNDNKIWYNFEESDTSSSTSDVQFIDKQGYRVEVLSTDNLDEANNIKSELSSRIQQNIYILFDSPFYKVRVGDFEDRNSAENHSFRLRQLGFQESRVVSDSVKIPGIK